LPFYALRRVSKESVHGTIHTLNMAAAPTAVVAAACVTYFYVIWTFLIIDLFYVISLSSFRDQLSKL